MNEEWHEKRSKGLGGSDSPVVLGVSPYKTRHDLALEKMGLMPDHQRETAPMKRGKALEPIVAELYAEKTGRVVVVEERSLVHPDHPFIIGNIDRWVERDKTGGVLEIKCPGMAVFGKCKREGLPQAWVIQLQHYLALTGATWGSFAVHNSELWELLWFDVERDTELIDMIIEEDGRFWEMIQSGQVPAEDTAPVLDLPPVVGGELVKIESAEWTGAVESLRSAKEILKEAEALEEEAKAEIKKLMAGAAIVEGGCLRAYHGQQAGRVSFDTKRAMKEHPEIEWKKYQKTGNPFETLRTYFLRERDA